VTYRLEIRETAEKQMKRLPANVLNDVVRRIMKLREEPRPHGVKKLAGGLGWRIRVGDYRVVYSIDDKSRAITIAAVKPRQSAYE
jgi:mRNA interferase RelE/StbE